MSSFTIASRRLIAIGLSICAVFSAHAGLCEIYYDRLNPGAPTTPYVGLADADRLASPIRVAPEMQVRNGQMRWLDDKGEPLVRLNTRYRNQDIYRGLEEGAAFDSIVVVTHQNERLETATAAFLQNRPDLEKAPRVILFNDSFSLKSRPLLDQSSRVVRSGAGEITTLKLNAARVHFTGGFCQLCLKRSVSSVMDHAVTAGRKEITLVFHPELIYTQADWKPYIVGAGLGPDTAVTPEIYRQQAVRALFDYRDDIRITEVKNAAGHVDLHSQIDVKGMKVNIVVESAAKTSKP